MKLPSCFRALAALATVAVTLLSGPAQAGLTSIAQVPLLNMTGTGSVKPNLMLLFDNSGSMDWHYLPDSVGYGTTYQCRSQAALRDATNTLCSPGHPPFMAAAFNKIYYNPATRYKPPVRADGSSYPTMDSTMWTAVPMDGFGSRALNLNSDVQGAADATTNLLTGYPDKAWCDSSARTNCLRNTSTYNLPDAAFTYSTPVTTGPYYYNIGVAQYCSDVNLTNCKSTTVGAPAPAGYPFPVTVRWCDTTSLTNCQAKQVGNFKYPSFSTPIGAVSPYGTITMRTSSAGTNKSMSVTSVSYNGTVISGTSPAMTAPTGTDTAAEREQLANKIASSIMSKTGLTQQYWACVRTPQGYTNINPCSYYGILLTSDEVVVVLPLDCSSTANKLPTNCSPSTNAANVSGTFSAVTPTASNSSDRIQLAYGSSTSSVAPASTFQRVDIVSTNNSYPRAGTRTDCVALTFCTYDEEMTNFANWYAYYKSRIQMTKTAVGLAFASVTGNFNVGLSRMSTSGAGGGIEVKPAVFDGDTRTNWYSTFYGTTTSGSTPTRAALDNVGKMFANQSPNQYDAGQEVVQFPCQQNFILLTTDGYWNQGYGGTVTSNDQIQNTSRFCTYGRACTDSRSQTVASLADIALYWYNGGSNTKTVSLRPSIDDVTKPGLVAGGPDENLHLHVNTFTLGLGIDGVMNYEGKYDTAPKPGGDFHSVLTRVGSGCPWNGGGAYVWPDPKVNDSTSNTIQERVDDLWHAAINGHGKYFSASDPAGVQAGLSEAIAGITVTVGAASAAATSTPNISKEDNNIFSDTFVTGKWSGELSDKQIDLTTGVVNATVLWNTSTSLGDRVGASTDTRVIKMIDSTTGLLKDFKYAAMSSLEKSWFDNKCNLMAQCPMLSTADKALVDSGANIVDWLRGQQQYANDRVLRTYYTTDPKDGPVKTIVLGDIASSKPAFLRTPTKSYTLAGYSQYKADNAARTAAVFTAANDGMLHSFNAVTGAEMWAYVPRITMQKLYKQANTNYSANHQFTTDGSPEIDDVQINNVWKSVLVAGLNGGGRGFYALDVTNPSTPVALWELCADPAICAKNDPDLGLSFGNPQFGMWQGKWVVFLTSGYNNVSGVDNVAVGTTGRGFLYIVDVADGTILKKIDTGNGSVGTPSGLAKITSISSNPFTDPVVTYVYGGDNTGQMFRFDLTSATAGAVSVIKMGDAGANQPITTRPDVTQCLETDLVNGVATPRAQRVVIFGTGRLLDLPDISNDATQSVYMLKDSGSPIANIRSAAMVQQEMTLKTSVADPDAPANSAVSLNTYTITKKAVDLAVNDGWYVDLSLNKGERVNLDPQIIDGGVNVVTTLPTASSSCTVGGTSNVYQFNVCTGTYVSSDSVVGSTLSNTAAAVGFIIVRLPSGSIKMITTTAKGTTITTNVTPPNSRDARKVGWRSVNGE